MVKVDVLQKLTSAEVVFLGLFEGKNDKNPAFKDLHGLVDPQALKEFKGRLGQTMITHHKGSIKRVLLVGLGKPEKFNLQIMRRACGYAATAVASYGLEELTIPIEEGKRFTVADLTEAAVEGVTLGQWVFDKYKTEDVKEKKSIQKLVIVTDNKTKATAGAERGRILSEAVGLTREITNTPALYMYPEIFVKEAIDVAKANGLKITVYDEKDLKANSMNAILAVGSGSGNPPRLVVLEYNPKGKRTIAIVGKGVCFDSGGLDIKPAQYMETMKEDKAGAATVLGIMQAASQLKLPVHIIGIAPMVENMPGNKAYKPGDVIVTSSGKTIEILNTDAEGRVILSDALHLATKFKPDAIIDLATLTGACVVALGTAAAGIMGNDQKLIDSLIANGEATGERLWQLPLWEEYDELIKGETGDIKNVVSNAGGVAGAITAASFLQHFVGDSKWAHLDIAGTAFNEKAFTGLDPKGATGFGVRLLISYLESLK